MKQVLFSAVLFLALVANGQEDKSKRPSPPAGPKSVMTAEKLILFKGILAEAEASSQRPRSSSLARNPSLNAAAGAVVTRNLESLSDL